MFSSLEHFREPNTWFFDYIENIVGSLQNMIKAFRLFKKEACPFPKHDHFCSLNVLSVLTVTEKTSDLIIYISIST